MKHAVSRELFSYWNTLRQGRTAPERAEIDPAAIRGVLSDTFILAGTAEPEVSTYNVRLAGTRLNALFLTELKGCDLLDLWRDEEREGMRRLFDTVLDDAAPLVAGLRGGPSDDRAVDLEMVLLPLRHQGRTHSRILGAIAPVQQPNWLGLLSVGQLSLTTLRLIETPLEAPLPARRPTPPRPAFLSAVAPRRYGRFVVHQGGR